jgi:hypothetical protein
VTSPFILAFPVTAAGASTSIAIDLSQYDGQWHRIEDEVANEARLSAIGRALEDLSWIMRKFASPILKKTTTPPTEMNFLWDGQRLHEATEGPNGDFSRTINLGGEFVVAKDHRGVDFSSAWSWTNSALNLRWEQHQAFGKNVYRIDSRNDVLIVEHTINVTAISNVQPIVFRSRFSRIDRKMLPLASDLGDDRLLEARTVLP